MYFHVYSFKLQIHAHIYRSFIRHHKMLGVRIAKRKTSLKSRAKANPCGTKLRARIFFVNTLQKETDLLFSESFATAGLFLFAFFQCSREKTQMLKNYFFAGSEFEHCFFEKYSSSNACGVLYFSVRCGLVSL